MLIGQPQHVELGRIDDYKMAPREAIIFFAFMKVEVCRIETTNHKGLPP
jgi:hypothetical protein